MRQHTKNTYLKKRIILVGGVTILLNSVLPMQASIVDSLRTAGSSVYQKIKGFDKAIIFDQLLRQIGKLGTQITDIKDCMFYGHDCTPAKQAAFYGTAISILALTAAVVGFTVTIAATSKEPDQDLNSAVESTSHEIKGWGPQQIMQRLSMRAEIFRQNLISMKQCLTTRKCTKMQKRALYATAATIVTLVVAAIGVSVGSYLYARTKRSQEITELPGELPIAEAPGVPTPGYRPSFTFDESPYPEKKVSAFGQLFRKTIEMTQDGKAYLQESFETIKGKVKNGAIKTKDAAAEAFLNLIEKGAEKGTELYSLIQHVFEVNLERVKQAIEETKEKFHTLTESIKEVKRHTFKSEALELFKYVQGLTAVVETINPLEPPAGYSPLKRLARIKGQDLEYLNNMLAVRKEELRKGKILPQQVQSVEDDIRIKRFINLDHLNSIYPTLVAKINALNLRKMGDATHTITNGLKALIDAALWIHRKAGKIGLLVSQDNAQRTLETLGERIKQLGIDIQKTTDIDKIVETEKLTTPDLAKSLVTAASSHGFAFLRKNWREIREAITTLSQADKFTDEIILSLLYFEREMKGIGANTKEQFIATIRKNPLKGIPHAARILRDSFETSVERTRNSFNELLKTCIVLLNTIKAGAPAIYTSLDALNGYMKATSNNPLINEQFLKGLRTTITNLMGTAATAEQLSKELDVVPEAAPAA